MVQCNVTAIVTGTEVKFECKRLTQTEFIHDLKGTIKREIYI